jgi:HD superfamily phosphohydrolase
LSANVPREWVIRDPVHGYIEPSPQEIDIIDQIVFQRLRGIKQLANTFLVFPGATHTRFEHSYGTMHMANMMALKIDSISRDADRRRRIRLAALVHDVGHGPFSHVSEDIVSRVLKKEKFGNIEIARDALELNEGIRTALGGDVDSVLELLGTPKKATVDHDILDSDLDADKLDYLSRDSQYAGVAYGYPDTLRILYTLREIPNADGSESNLGISLKGKEAVEGLRIARYHMHSVVYNHKVRRIADAMVVKAVMAAIENKTLDSNYFDYRKGDRDFLDKYFSLDDRNLMDQVIRGGGAPAQMMEHLRQRKLLKKAYEKDMSEFKGPTKDRIVRMDPQRIGELEGRVASEAGVDALAVIIDKQSIENPTFKAPAGLPEPRRILVDTKPHPMYLDEMPGLWSSEVKFMQKLWVFSGADTKDRVGEIAGRIFESL